jgi:hypothetical protein
LLEDFVEIGMDILSFFLFLLQLAPVVVQLIGVLLLGLLQVGLNLLHVGRRGGSLGRHKNLGGVVFEGFHLAWQF